MNPYEPPNAVEMMSSRTRDWERDQCPYCLHRQGRWNAINSWGQYRCKRCEQKLTVRLPTWFTVLFVAAWAAFAVAYYINWFSFRTSILWFLSMAAPLVGQLAFGYFHPPGPRIYSRAELDSPEGSPSVEPL